jgi:RimJ/RimL family protein N-acetyltransferase
MKETYTTERLNLNVVSKEDFEFIFKLVNSEGWIRFIGDRHVRTSDDAKAYLKRIMDNLNVVYWKVSLKETKEPIGIITFIKRDYLNHHDIGFAFLPEFSGKGYAYEASKKVLEDLLQNGDHEVIVATTLAENTNSIKLLSKLGFDYSQKVNDGDEELLLYSITAYAFL